jgi:NAD(P)-dependent dehydrogenase (short-subunit alcohol dehydrogenase family)
MREAGRGTIVNISSVAGKRGWANAGAYCASKFALTGFTQALNAEGKSYGIRACVIFPGAMATGWGTWSSARREALDPETERRNRALPPEDVAALVVWIASAPRELVLNEVIATPLDEQGWP